MNPINYVQIFTILLYCSLVASSQIVVLNDDHPIHQISRNPDKRVSRLVLEEIYSCLRKKEYMRCLYDLKEKLASDAGKKLLAGTGKDNGVGTGNSPGLNRSLNAVRRNSNDDFIRKKILRTVSDESAFDGSDSADNLEENKSDSDEEEVRVPKRNKKYKNNVIDIKKKPKLMSMQGPGRLIETRKRVPAFVPRQYYLDPNSEALSNNWMDK